MKAIHFQDPRKKKIVALLKNVSGGSRVTMLFEHSDIIMGDCLKRSSGSWIMLGTYSISTSEVGGLDELSS